MKSLETISLRPAPCAAETICRAMVREEEESQRFQVRCAEIIADQGWPVTAHRGEIEALLSKRLPNFRLAGDKLKIR